MLIVGGRFAEGVALNYGFYSCQAKRKFRTAKYVAFYFNKRISHVFEMDGSPIQVKSLEDVAHLIPENYYLTDEDKKPHTFMRLKEITTLKVPITHDYPNPFVQRQRYTTIEKMLSAKTTDDLL